MYRSSVSKVFCITLKDLYYCCYSQIVSNLLHCTFIESDHHRNTTDQYYLASGPVSDIDTVMCIFVSAVWLWFKLCVLPCQSIRRYNVHLVGVRLAVLVSHYCWLADSFPTVTKENHNSTTELMHLCHLHTYYLATTMSMSVPIR